jgi:ribosome maturation factor RimP
MDHEQLLTQLYEWIEPILLKKDLVIYHLDYTQEGRDWVLEILLTKTNGDSVELEVVTECSRLISAELDLHEWTTHEYLLDVSSAGAERPLYTIEQVIAAQGSYVAVILKEPMEKDRQWLGYLRQATTEEITIECRVKTRLLTLRIPYTNIDFIRLSVIF